MVLRFGDFEIDPAGRALRLFGKPCAVQPKVFDLLVYFVGNAGRIIPKDELLDQLWPRVHVTEASLQRAVSLVRQVLRAGQLESALKSFPGRGYRFAIDEPNLNEFLPMPPQGEDAGAAHALATSRNWAGVVKLFEGLGEIQLGGRDLELWAFALECLGRPGDAIARLQAAVGQREIEGVLDALATDCVTLAKIHFERGEAAVARGWLARAEAKLPEGPSEARAYLLWMQGRVHASEGRPERALATAEAALAAAEACNSHRLRALALCCLGFFNLSLGKVRLGLEQQDHAAALAMSATVDPITGGLIYCNILWACRCYGDWNRASQWQEGFETWCQANMDGVSASCQLHRAEASGMQATLDEALVQISDAISRLPVAEPWAIGDAYRVRGDIHSAQGNVDAARQDYVRAYEIGWDAEPGHALLLFESGDTEGAVAALDRALASENWFGLQRRGWILANKARLCALAGRDAEARGCLDALVARYDEWPSQAIRALAQEAEALLTLSGAGSSPRAIQLLHLARQIWTSIGAEYQAARVRLALSFAMMAVNDRAGAQVEARCCEAAAERYGARLLRDKARSLLASLEASA